MWRPSLSSYIGNFHIPPAIMDHSHLLADGEIIDILQQWSSMTALTASLCWTAQSIIHSCYTLTILLNFGSTETLGFGMLSLSLAALPIHKTIPLSNKFQSIFVCSITLTTLMNSSCVFSCASPHDLANDSFFLSHAPATFLCLWRATLPTVAAVTPLPVSALAALAGLLGVLWSASAARPSTISPRIVYLTPKVPLRPEPDWHSRAKWPILPQVKQPLLDLSDKLYFESLRRLPSSWNYTFICFPPRELWS